MTAEQVLCRQFSRMGARLKLFGPRPFQWGKLQIDVGNDSNGEFFSVHCKDGAVPEVVDVRPELRHLVLMVRDGRNKNKFLLGHDERHWFAAAVPGDSIRDVGTAMASLRPAEVVGDKVVRQGEWFFVPVPGLTEGGSVIHHNEPLSRGAGSKPHVCEEMIRRGGETVMVCQQYSTGVRLGQYERIIASDPKAQRWNWRRMVRDAEVFARGRVRHSDHKTITLNGWHRVFMNRERFAVHAAQIAFLD